MLGDVVGFSVIYISLFCSLYPFLHFLLVLQQILYAVLVCIHLPPLHTARSASVLPFYPLANAPRADVLPFLGFSFPFSSRSQKSLYLEIWISPNQKSTNCPSFSRSFPFGFVRYKEQISPAEVWGEGVASSYRSLGRRFTDLHQLREEFLPSDCSASLGWHLSKISNLEHWAAFRYLAAIARSGEDRSRETTTIFADSESAC